MTPGELSTLAAPCMEAGGKPRKELPRANFRRGEEHGNAKLSDEQVRRLREVREEQGLSYTQLGKRFGCKAPTARDIVKGFTREYAGGPIEEGRAPHASKVREFRLPGQEPEVAGFRVTKAGLSKPNDALVRRARALRKMGVSYTVISEVIAVPHDTLWEQTRNGRRRKAGMPSAEEMREAAAALVEWAITRMVEPEA